jgi:molecular chaperone GrpE
MSQKAQPPGADPKTAGEPEPTAAQVPEPAAEEPNVATADPADPLAQALAETAHWKDMALRARADLENFRKRIGQETAEARRYANAALLESLLPILDNFQFGLQAAQSDPSGKNLLEGLKMVAAQLQNFLKDLGVEEINAVGQPFDPNIHEAVAQEPNERVPEGKISSQIRRGFRLRERLLRPASVVVSTGAGKGGGVAR